MGKSKKELELDIEDLKKRLYELERRPIYVPVPTQRETYYPNEPWSTPIVWC